MIFWVHFNGSIRGYINGNKRFEIKDTKMIDLKYGTSFINKDISQYQSIAKNIKNYEM